jgi:hypothetical protein
LSYFFSDQAIGIEYEYLKEFVTVVDSFAILSVFEIISEAVELFVFEFSFVLFVLSQIMFEIIFELFTCHLKT